MVFVRCRDRKWAEELSVLKVGDKNVCSLKNKFKISLVEERHRCHQKQKIKSDEHSDSKYLLSMTAPSTGLHWDTKVVPL